MPFFFLKPLGFYSYMPSFNKCFPAPTRDRYQKWWGCGKIVELGFGETPVSEGTQEDPSEKPVGLLSPGMCGGWRNLLCGSRNQVWRECTWSPQCNNGLVQCIPIFAPHSGSSKLGSLLFSPYDIFPIIFFKKITLKHISLET